MKKCQKSNLLDSFFSLSLLIWHRFPQQYSPPRELSHNMCIWLPSNASILSDSTHIGAPQWPYHPPPKFSNLSRFFSLVIWHFSLRTVLSFSLSSCQTLMRKSFGNSVKGELTWRAFSQSMVDRSSQDTLKFLLN